MIFEIMRFYLEWLIFKFMKAGRDLLNREAHMREFVGLIYTKRISVFYMAINNVRMALKYFRMP